MTLKDAMRARHSVRAYIDKPIDQKSLDALSLCIKECNAQGDLNIQLVTNEPNAFGKSFLGSISGGAPSKRDIGQKPHLSATAAYAAFLIISLVSIPNYLSFLSGPSSRPCRYAEE